MARPSGRRHSLPRGRAATPCAVVLVAAVAAAVVVTPQRAGADAALTPATAGMGSAIAQSYRVNPTAASLSIGITFGLSLARFSNSTALAESRAVDLGIVGTTLAAQQCDGGAPAWPADQQPQALRADSHDPAAANGYTAPEKDAPLITKSARATSSPDGEANTTTLPLGDGKTLDISGARSTARTHLVDGAREALATSDIANLTLGGGVHLSNLHWEAVHRTGSGGSPTTKAVFTIGAATINGNAVPTGDPGAVFTAVNTALAPMGLELDAPRSHVDAGILFVDPLRVAVVPNANRDGVSGAVLQGVAPVRQPLVDGMIKAACRTASLLTVADIVAGSITGSGSFAVEIGGVQASTAAIKTSTFLQPLPSLAPLPSLTAPGLGQSVPASAPVSSGASTIAAPSGQTALEPATSSLGTAANVDAVANGGTVRRQAAPAAAVEGKRGGAMAVVALAGLALLLGMAEADRRMMRRSQRSATRAG